MDSIYLIIVIVLLALAALDLIVGVANDAVNFLNSSIGSKGTSLGDSHRSLTRCNDWSDVLQRDDGGGPKRCLLSGTVHLPGHHDTIPGSDDNRCDPARSLQHLRVAHFHHCLTGV